MKRVKRTKKKRKEKKRKAIKRGKEKKRSGFISFQIISFRINKLLILNFRKMKKKAG